MPEESAKRRLRRAKEKAMDDLEKIGYKIVPSDNSSFCLCGVRRAELRMIRIVVDEITDRDIDIVKAFNMPNVCSREVWCKIEGQRSFLIKEV